MSNYFLFYHDRNYSWRPIADASTMEEARRKAMRYWTDGASILVPDERPGVFSVFATDGLAIGRHLGFIAIVPMPARERPTIPTEIPCQ